MYPEAETTLPLPPPAQIALSLVLLKHKPVSLTVQEYIESLQQHVSSQPVKSQDHIQKHIESSKMWKEAYEKSETAQEALLDRIYELERQLAAQSSGPSPVPAIGNADKGKRKRNEQTVTKANSRLKRRAVSTKPSEIETPQSDRLDDQDFGAELGQNKILTRLFRALSNLRRVLSLPDSEDQTIGTAIRILCRTGISVVTDLLSCAVRRPKINKNSVDRGDIADLSVVCAAVTRAYPSLLQALDRLCLNVMSLQICLAANAEIVHFFQSILGQLHAIVLQEATTRGAKPANKIKLDREGARPSDSKHQFNIIRAQLCQELVKLLAFLTTSLDLTKIGDCQLLEGLLSAFLDHLGSSLSLVVFADVEEARLKTVSLGMLPPQGLQDSAGMETTIATRTAHVESRYLVYLLKRIMAFLSSHGEAQDSSTSELFSFTDSTGLGRKLFMARSKDRLQKTLLRGMFGEHDDAAKDALSRADEVDDVDLKDLGDEFEMVNEGSSEWFIGEVWNYLGWEILSKDI